MIADQQKGMVNDLIFFFLVKLDHVFHESMTNHSIADNDDVLFPSFGHSVILSGCYMDEARDRCRLGILLLFRLELEMILVKRGSYG